MKILNVITTKNATSKTENAIYNFEYSISDNELVKVSIYIYENNMNPEQEKQDIYIGHILLENNMLSASFSDNIPASKLMSDYENILRQVKDDISSM